MILLRSCTNASELHCVCHICNALDRGISSGKIGHFFALWIKGREPRSLAPMACSLMHGAPKIRPIISRGLCCSSCSCFASSDRQTVKTHRQPLPLCVHLLVWEPTGRSGRGLGLKATFVTLCQEETARALGHCWIAEHVHVPTLSGPMQCIQAPWPCADFPFLKQGNGLEPNHEQER